MAILVIKLTLLLVTEYIVSLIYLFKMLCR